MRRVAAIRYCLVLALLGFIPAHGDAQPAASRRGEIALRTAMRKLWTDHVARMRQYILDGVAGAPSLDATTKRLDVGSAKQFPVKV
jgi:hypothetical protein